MRNKIDNILLGTLWVLACTLGGSFWFNIKYGFNIFSKSHWHHLAYMQASQMPVKTSFYISMVIAVFLAIFGMYLLFRPKFRRIKIHVQMPSKQPTVPATQNTPQPVTPPTPQNTAPSPQQPITPNIPLSRPARLNINTPATFMPPTQSATPATQPPKASDSDWPELRKIFESVGYTVKKNPRIGKLQTALFAIGTDEVLYLGAMGASVSDMQAAINKLQQIFADTLEDIYIDTIGFIIGAPDTPDANSPILTFSSVSELRTYMQSHPNKQPSDDEAANFDAYSGYISTVIDYIGKI
ncbi:MAG: hypothetical protein IJD52_02725 [Alphaproteobacteria bacterium]|nr:hypothetical protein [Alphaproteobacteria bacterium]